jgi:hypothetical protein
MLARRVSVGAGDRVPALVQFVVQRVGATMHCNYCRRVQLLSRTDVVEEILEFQDAHFACDPVLELPVARGRDGL